MTYLHAFLEIIGALAILWALWKVVASRDPLDRFSNPNEPKLAKITRLRWLK